VYLNTYVPYKDFLFLTNKIESFDLVDKLIKDAMHGLNLKHNLPAPQPQSSKRRPRLKKSECIL